MKSKAKSIQDNDFWYNILSPVVQYATKCHYQSYTVRGIENLPSEGSYIIAPCHQQALMEPLAVLAFSPKPPVFLARADIFAKPAIRKILTFLKILPVYRIRDGKDNLSKNNDIFDKSRDVLLDGFPLCLMAEGRHNNRHHLLPFGKGMFRIAGEAQQMLGDHPLYIVPTGIDFDHYERPYSNLVVNIGKPIPVKPFMATYTENEPLALNQMRKALFDALLPLMHDIRSDENYEEIFTLCKLLTKSSLKAGKMRNNAWNRFVARQKLSQRFSAPSDALLSKVRSYKTLCAELSLDEELPPNHLGIVPLLAALLGVGVLAWGVVSLPVLRSVLLFWLLCYPLPLVPTHLVVKPLVADSQFRSSFNFGVRFLLSILYAIVIAVVVAAGGGLWMNQLLPIGGWWGLVAVALVVAGGRMAAPVVRFIQLLSSNCRYWMLRLFRRKTMKAIGSLCDEIHNCAQS